MVRAALGPQETFERAAKAASRAGLAKGRVCLVRYGVTAAEPVLKDDDPRVTGLITEITEQLVSAGTIRRERHPCHTCTECGMEMFTVETRSKLPCAHCGGRIEESEKQAWFLSTPWETVERRAKSIRWVPESALPRFLELERLGPRYPVAVRRGSGIPFSREPGQFLDQRFIGALYPALLRRLGFKGEIVCVAGADILRKWLLLMISANPDESQPGTVLTHGMLLDPAGKKLSKYVKGHLQVPQEPGSPQDELRAELLRQPFGKDFVLTGGASVYGSRLSRKYLNILKFLSQHAPASASGHAALLAGVEAKAAAIRENLTPRSFQPQNAMDTFRDLCFESLSKQVIPAVRGEGISEEAKRALMRVILSLGKVLLPQTEKEFSGDSA